MLSVFGLTGRGRKPYVIDVLRDGVMFKRVRKGFNGDGLLWSFVDVMVLCMVLCMCTC